MARVHTRGVISLRTSEVLEDESYEYEGDFAQAKGGGDTTQNTVSEPPSWQTPYIKDVLQRSQDLYNAGAKQYYPGSTIAPVNPTLQQGWNTTVGATPAAQSSAGAAQNALEFQLGAGANPMTNPYFQQMQDAIVRNSVKGLSQALPSIDAGAVQAGGYGGSRQGIAQGMAFDTFSQNMIDRLAQMGSEAYNQGQETQSRALALAPSTMGAYYLPGQMTTGVGGAIQDYNQSVLGDEVNRWNFNQQAPYDALSFYSSMVGNPLGSNVNVNTQGASQSPWLSALGGGMTGAALGAAIPGFGAGAGTMLGPAGWAGMALGAGLGLFNS